MCKKCANKKKYKIILRDKYNIYNKKIYTCKRKYCIITITKKNTCLMAELILLKRRKFLNPQMMEIAQLILFTLFQLIIQINFLKIKMYR